MWFLRLPLSQHKTQLLLLLQQIQDKLMLVLQLQIRLLPLSLINQLPLPQQTRHPLQLKPKLTLLLHQMSPPLLQQSKTLLLLLNQLNNQHRMGLKKLALPLNKKQLLLSKQIPLHLLKLNKLKMKLLPVPIRHLQDLLTGRTFNLVLLRVLLSFFWLSLEIVHLSLLLFCPHKWTSSICSLPHQWWWVWCTLFLPWLVHSLLISSLR